MFGDIFVDGDPKEAIEFRIRRNSQTGRWSLEGYDDSDEHCYLFESPFKRVVFEQAEGLGLARTFEGQGNTIDVILTWPTGSSTHKASKPDSHTRRGPTASFRPRGRPASMGGRSKQQRDYVRIFLPFTPDDDGRAVLTGMQFVLMATIVIVLSIFTAVMTGIVGGAQGADLYLTGIAVAALFHFVFCIIIAEATERPASDQRGVRRGIERRNMPREVRDRTPRGRVPPTGPQPQR